MIGLVAKSSGPSKHRAELPIVSILLSIRDWDLPEIKDLLAHSHRSLKTGDLVVIHETFLNSRKTGPLAVAEYSCILAHSTQGRCYSTLEMADLLNEAGFEGIRSFDTSGDRGVVLAKKKPT